MKKVSVASQKTIWDRKPKSRKTTGLKTETNKTQNRKGLLRKEKEK